MGEPQLPERFTIPPGQDVAAFANVYQLRKPSEMVYLDFIQVDVGADPPGHATVVARLVITPSLASELADALAALDSSPEG